MKKLKNINLKEIINKPNTKIILTVLLVLLLVIPLWYKNKNDDIETKEKDYANFAHTEPEIIKEETVNGLVFSNISLITKDGYTTFYADVTNTAESESNDEKVYIDLKDKKGKTSISLKAVIGKLAPNESTSISTKAKGTFKEVTSKQIREYKN